MSLKDLIKSRTDDYAEKKCVGFSPDQYETVSTLITDLKQLREAGEEFAPGKATGRMKEVKKDESSNGSSSEGAGK